MNAWPMYRAMVGTGLLCGALIVTVYKATGPVIERNKAAALERAIFLVLPEARSSATFHFDDASGFAAPGEERSGGQRVHAGYDDQRRLVGLALEAGGMGYQDVIHLLYGYSFEQEAIVGIRVLDSKETPGLGDKIETDPEFLRNFERLDVTLAADGSQLAHAIEAVKRGKKTRPWQVDGITGATVSSQAIADILDRSAAIWIPRIMRHLDDFRAVE